MFTMRLLIKFQVDFTLKETILFHLLSRYCVSFVYELITEKALNANCSCELISNLTEKDSK